jgi:hypothetical protein
MQISIFYQLILILNSLYIAISIGHSNVLIFINLSNAQWLNIVKDRENVANLDLFAYADYISVEFLRSTFK